MVHVEPEKEGEDVKGFPKDGKAIDAVGVHILEGMVADTSPEVAHQLDDNPPDLQNPPKIDDPITGTLEGKHAGSDVVSERPMGSPDELSEIEILLGDEALMDDVIANILEHEEVVNNLLGEVIDEVAEIFQHDAEFRGKLIATALADPHVRGMVKRDLLADAS